MIIFLYGEDIYSSLSKLKEIIASYQEKNSSGMNIVFFNEKDSFSAILDCEKQTSMFQEKKLLVIKKKISLEDTKKEVLSNFEKMLSSENIFIFYEEEKIKKDNKFLQLLLKEKIKKSKNILVQEFPFLTPLKVNLWIKKEFQKNNVEVEEDAVFSLSKIGGKDLWRLKNEIEKLSLYKNKITKKDVLEMVKMSVETNIFKTIDAIADRDKEKAFLFLYDHIEKEDSPHYLFSMIVYQMRNIITVKSIMEKNLSYEEMKKKSGLHPFVFSKTQKQAQKFSKEELQKSYQHLFELDLKIKTGQVDPVLALHLFLFNF